MTLRFIYLVYHSSAVGVRCRSTPRVSSADVGSEVEFGATSALAGSTSLAGRRTFPFGGAMGPFALSDDEERPDCDEKMLKA